MGIQLSEGVENIVGKGVIARYEMFSKLSVVNASK